MGMKEYISSEQAAYVDGTQMVHFDSPEYPCSYPPLYSLYMLTVLLRHFLFALSFPFLPPYFTMDLFTLLELWRSLRLVFSSRFHIVQPYPSVFLPPSLHISSWPSPFFHRWIKNIVYSSCPKKYRDTLGYAAYIREIFSESDAWA